MNALTIQNLKKIYGNGFEALKGIDLEVKAGDFFGLLGPNGAGKTTTIGIVSSLVSKTSGNVSIFGHDIDSDFSAAKACIGIVPQEFNFAIFDKVLHIVLNQAGYYGIDRKTAYIRAEKYLKQLGLWDKRYQPARSLSGGMKRRLMIVRALVHEPKLLILDEPTAGVDIELRRSMWDFLRTINQAGTTIILTTHYLEEAESLCRNIAIINHGKIVENTSVRELLTKLDVETFILDVDACLKEDFVLDQFVYRVLDDHCLEVDVPKCKSMNEIFRQLSEQGISVKSMRNKVNRLEELFVRLTA